MYPSPRLNLTRTKDVIETVYVIQIHKNTQVSHTRACALNVRSHTPEHKNIQWRILARRPRARPRTRARARATSHVARARRRRRRRFRFPRFARATRISARDRVSVRGRLARAPRTRRSPASARPASCSQPHLSTEGQTFLTQQQGTRHFSRALSCRANLTLASYGLASSLA